MRAVRCVDTPAACTEIDLFLPQANVRIGGDSPDLGEAEVNQLLCELIDNGPAAATRCGTCCTCALL